MLLLLLACAPDAPPTAPEPNVAMDGTPDATLTEGAWTFAVSARGATVSGPRTLDLGPNVLQGAAFHPAGTTLAFARTAETPLSDLFVLNLESGAEVRLTDWPGYEDRPVFSPDGSKLAFFSGRTGLASLYVAELPSPLQPLDAAAVTQLTNVGLETKRRVGAPPEGYVPPPDDGRVSWTHAGITWVAGGRDIVVSP